MVEADAEDNEDSALLYSFCGVNETDIVRLRLWIGLGATS